MKTRGRIRTVQPGEEKILYWPDFVVAFHYFEGA